MTVLMKINLKKTKERLVFLIFKERVCQVLFEILWQLFLQNKKRKSKNVQYSFGVYINDNKNTNMV